MTEPRKATGLDDLPKALEDWESNKGLYTESGGVLPEESQERLAFIEMLPADINVYITMHMDLEDHRTLQALKRFTLKYVKVLQNLKRKPGVHLVDHGGDGGPVGDGSVAGDSSEGMADDGFEAKLADIMDLEHFVPDDQAEICAFVTTRLQNGRPGFAPRRPAGQFTGRRSGVEFLE